MSETATLRIHPLTAVAALALFVILLTWVGAPDDPIGLPSASKPGKVPVSGEALPAENYTIEELAFPPSPHRLYVNDMKFMSGMVIGSIHVLDADNGSYMGVVSHGGSAPFVLSHDQKWLYTADMYYSRGTRGERTDVLTAHDTSTLAPTWEVELPAKRSSHITERFALTLSDDGRFAFVFNMTPATSVSVVNLETREFVTEISIAGCALAYPAGRRRFASICGDGALLVVNYDDLGEEAGRTRVPFFDPASDLLLERAARVGDTYYFASYGGDVHSVDFSGAEVVVGEPWSLTSEEERGDGWRPGGWELIAASESTGLLFALVHPDGYAGSHKDPSQHIWIYDLAKRSKVREIESERPLWSLMATSDEKPLLIGLSIDGAVEVIDIRSREHLRTISNLFETAAVAISH